MYCLTFSSREVIRIEKCWTKRFASSLISIVTKPSQGSRCSTSSKSTRLTGWNTTQITKTPTFSKEKTSLFGGACSSGYSKTFSCPKWDATFMPQRSKRNTQGYSITGRMFGTSLWKSALRTCCYRMSKQSKRLRWSTSVRAAILRPLSLGLFQKEKRSGQLWHSIGKFLIAKTKLQTKN